jgi:hypothetical protein
MITTIEDVKLILDLMYSTTDIINKFKFVTANFLESNSSISSIPRNYIALRDKHLDWLKEYVIYVENNAPNWDIIVDEETYEKIARSIQAFRLNITQDNSLLQLELLFISDVKFIRSKIFDLIKNDLDSLLLLYSLKPVKAQLGKEGINLEKTLNDIRKSLVNYTNFLSKIISLTSLFI